MLVLELISHSNKAEQLAQTKQKRVSRPLLNFTQMQEAEVLINTQQDGTGNERLATSAPCNVNHHHDMHITSKCNMWILYYNARSLLPKFDNLLLSVNVLRPHIICIVET